MKSLNLPAVARSKQPETLCCRSHRQLSIIFQVPVSLYKTCKASAYLEVPAGSHWHLKLQSWYNRS